MSAVRAGRRAFACRAARAMDLPDAPAFPVDHAPPGPDADPPAAAHPGTGGGRWPHALSHRGCGDVAPAPPIVIRTRRWAER